MADLAGAVGPGQVPGTVRALSSGRPAGGSHPLVRVVVVNHDGGPLAVACIESLLSTEWPPGRLEVVLVDNASSDGVAALARRRWPQVRVVESGRNLGFGGGCNLGLQDLGECRYAALVNPDAQVDPGWLTPLVAALETDRSVGAASPKILLSGSYLQVVLECPTSVRGRGDRRPLGVRLSGVELDGREAGASVKLAEGLWGPEYRRGEPVHQWTRDRALLYVPARGDGTAPGCRLHLSADSERTVTATSDGARAEHRVGPVPSWVDVPLAGEPFDLVNNVGSVLLPDGYAADRGYLEPDHGQYDAVEDVFAWCGAAVLLSRRYLESVGGFCERFFLYYEDLDLSWRGRAQGWRHLYVPTSVVRHVHAASTVEHSRLFDHLVERNRLLVLTRNAPAGLLWRAPIRHLLITGSYLCRDVLAPLAHGDDPSWEVVRRRMGALAAWLTVLPGALVERRGLRRARRVPTSAGVREC